MGLVTQTDGIYFITVFILIVFKICGSSKSNYLSFDQNHLIKNPILFCKYHSPQKSHRNGFVFKIFVWISIFWRKKLFKNCILGCLDIKQTRLLIFFLIHPVEHHIPKLYDMQHHITILYIIQHHITILYIIQHRVFLCLSPSQP